MFLSTNGNFDLVARLCFRSDDPCTLFLPKKMTLGQTNVDMEKQTFVDHCPRGSPWDSHI